MASPVNVGRFRHILTLSYKVGETITDLGSVVASYEDLCVAGLVDEMDSKQKLAYGLNVEQSHYKVYCRNVRGDLRPVKIANENREMRVVSCKTTDDRKRFIEMIAVHEQ